MRAPAIAFAAASISIAVALSASTPARACAICGAGDPTLAAMGAERAFRDSARVTGSVHLGSARIGPDPDATRLDEERFDFIAAFAPIEGLFLSVDVPIVWRQAVGVESSTASTFTFGDIEVRAKGVFYHSEHDHVHHQLAIVGGLKLPSAPVTTDVRQTPLPPDIQAGTGAIEPFVGGLYAVRRGPWSLTTTTTLYLPFAIREAPHAGDLFRATLFVQHQPVHAFAARIGLSARGDPAGAAYGTTDPSSGGFVGYVSTEMVFSPIADFLLTLGAFFPAVQALRGAHHEGPIAGVSIALER